MTLRDGRRSTGAITGAEVFPLGDTAYVLLRNLIVEHTGVWYDEGKRSILADKLSELVTANGLTSFLDYYYLLRYDDAADQHWTALMNRLSVPETFFWRQADQIEALARVIAPAHFAQWPDRPLRIWSAACCTGEEPLSIAMALAEAGLLGTRPIEIVATDGSPAMVERARAGLYSERSFRQIPEALRETYFEEAGPGRWRPIPMLRDAVRWGVANLVRPAEIAHYAGSDVIFCRNVFIYFSDDAIRGVIKVMSERMPRDGYLFLSASESLTRLGVDFEVAEVGGSFVYVRSGRRIEVEDKLPTPGRPGARIAAVPKPPQGDRWQD